MTAQATSTSPFRYIVSHQIALDWAHHRIYQSKHFPITFFNAACSLLSIHGVLTGGLLTELLGESDEKPFGITDEDIDARLSVLLQTIVTLPGATPQLTIVHMVAEAERVATSDAESLSYSAFLEVAKTPGTVVEASTREILYLVQKMREFIEQYSITREGSYAPVIVYHADKVFHMLHMVHDLGGTQKIHSDSLLRLQTPMGNSFVV